MLGAAVADPLPQLCSFPVYLAGSHAHAGDADSLTLSVIIFGDDRPNVQLSIQGKSS